MKIRSMQTCIMSSLPQCIFRCSVFRYVTLVSFFLFFFQTLLFNCNSFTLVANKYLLTYLLAIVSKNMLFSQEKFSYCTVIVEEGKIDKEFLEGGQLLDLIL